MLGYHTVSEDIIQYLGISYNILGYQYLRISFSILGYQDLRISISQNINILGY
jgi:hypothetical protein